MHSAQSGVTHGIVESSANQAFGSHSQWRTAYGGKVSSLDSSYIISGERQHVSHLSRQGGKACDGRESVEGHTLRLIAFRATKRLTLKLGNQH